MLPPKEIWSISIAEELVIAVTVSAHYVREQHNSLVVVEEQQHLQHHHNWTPAITTPTTHDVTCGGNVTLNSMLATSPYLQVYSKYGPQPSP